MSLFPIISISNQGTNKSAFNPNPINANKAKLPVFSEMAVQRRTKCVISHIIIVQGKIQIVI